MLREEIQKLALDLATKAYTNRAESPVEVSSEGAQEAVKKSLDNLSIFVEQLKKQGKKIYLAIEFGIGHAERYRFYQITNLLVKEGFREYDPDAIYIVVGIDGEFRNERMLNTLEELFYDSDRRPYTLVNEDNLREDSRRFQVGPLPGAEVEVREGQANLFSFEVKEREQDIIPNGPNITKKNTNKKGPQERKLQFYVYFIQHLIKSSYYNDCKDVVLYHKAQQSPTIKYFSRFSAPVFPFWQALHSLSKKEISKIYYANIAHYESNGFEYIGGAYRKGVRFYQLRTNKFSEKMSEIWYMLLKVKETQGTPSFIIDLDLGSNRTFDTQGPLNVVPLTEELSFKKEDEIPRIAISRNTYSSNANFITHIGEASFDPGTPQRIEAINWESLCEHLVNGGGRTKKAKRRSNKTKKRRNSRVNSRAN